MERSSIKTIKFEGTKISNLNEMFSAANGLHGDGWHDYYNPKVNIAISQRTVSGWLNKEDSVIIFSQTENRWYRFHGVVSITETFGSHLRSGQHMVVIQPLHFTFDVSHSEEEPEGRKDRYKDFPDYVRDSVNEVTLEAPSFRRINLCREQSGDNGINQNRYCFETIA